MARWQPLQVVGGAYADDALPWSAQDCVNYVPVVAEKGGTRSPAMLRQLPGCATFSITGITASGLSYSASQNHEPDGDSTGTTITIAKP